ncbi:MAG TPA: ribonuclease P protein component [Verrucomicrobiae bacterium]|nr:ribonuclease P protein component [Verrucomicrobiae bacterium]
MSTAPKGSLGLPRARRIKQGRDFARARAEGRRLVQGCLIMNWIVLPPGSVSRVGVITMRKLGHAPARSRARRLLREAFRLGQHCLRAPADIVLVARHSIAGRKFAEVERDFLAALQRAGIFRAPEGPR